MSILLMSRVFATALTPSRKIVLLALADFANDSGKNIFPSVMTLAKKSSLSRRSVQMILGNFIDSEIIRIAKNPFGGAPGTTRHLEINLEVLDRMMRISLGENSAPVSETGADDCREGAQNDVNTSEALAPKPPNNCHRTTTAEKHQESCRSGDAENFDWPPQLDTEERKAIQTVFSSLPNGHQQKQFALDELRAALASREIPRRAAWVRTVLKKGVERTHAGKGFERVRKEVCERKENQLSKPSESKTQAEKNVNLERLRKVKESLKK